MPRKHKPSADPFNHLFQSIMSRAQDKIDSMADSLLDAVESLIDDAIHQTQRKLSGKGVGAGIGNQPHQARPKRRERPMPEPTHYDTLGVSPSATQFVIEAAYKSWAKRAHPDVNKSAGAAEIMRKMNEAWEVLGDPVKRKEYDKGLRR